MIVSLLGFILGCIVLIKNLAIFNKYIKTPSIDSWLVFVGTLAWSLMLFSEIYHDVELLPEELFARMLFLILWCGLLLKVKHYCLQLKKRKLKRGVK